MAKFLVFLIGLLAILAGWAAWDERPDDAVWWNNECTRMDLTQRLKVLEFRYEQAELKFNYEDWLREKKALEGLQVTVSELEAKRDELQIENSEAVRAMADFRKSTLENIRLSRIGTELGDFECPSGRIYSDASVVAVRDAGVTVRHRDGIARMGFNDLSSDQRVFFGLEEESSAKAIQRESAKAHQYLSWLETRMAQIGEEEEARELNEAKLAEASARRVSLANNYRRATTKSNQMVSRLSQPAKPVGNPNSSTRTRRYRRSSRTYYIYPATNRYYRWYRPTYIPDQP